MTKEEASKIIRKQLMNLMQVPVPIVLAGIESLIRSLQLRGVEIKDWDNKDRTLKQVRMIGGKVYFFAEEKEENSKGQGGSGDA